MVSLGASDVRVSPLGIGAWAWGARSFWGDYSVPDLQAAFDTSLGGGVNFLDTAEIYGSGRSETLIGTFLQATDKKPFVATKFFPLPWRLTKGSFKKALQGSLKRLGLQKIDLYQIHWPSPPMPIDVWVSALGDVIEAGLVRLGGISNYNVEQTRQAHALLADRGIHLTSNQVHYSLLHRNPEHSGLLDLCRELNITLIAYSPLEQGVLTGKYTPNTPLPGVRGRRYDRDFLLRVQPLIGLMREIGQAYGGKTPVQVAVNWVISKGAFPIPGARNARQAQEILGSLGWKLTHDEVFALEQAAEKS
ncbi:MAG: aldo/keto reductase [Anaerolineae bacterium]|nr:aldo/keto reductase [Anaerolineae bacterium]